MLSWLVEFCFHDYDDHDGHHFRDLEKARDAIANQQGLQHHRNAANVLQIRAAREGEFRWCASAS